MRNIKNLLILCKNVLTNAIYIVAKCLGKAVERQYLWYYERALIWHTPNKQNLAKNYKHI